MEREPQFSSIEDLIQYNIDWLRNPRGVNYISVIDATEATETEETADLLIRLNESGFITIDSQCGNETDEYSERAYVVGYISNTIAPRLFEDLNRLGYLCVIIRVDDLLNLQEKHGDALLALRIPVTLVRLGEDLSVEIYQKAVGFSEHPEFLRNLPANVAQDFRQNWSLLIAVDPVHGRRCDEEEEGLFNQIISLLESY